MSDALFRLAQVAVPILVSVFDLFILVLTLRKTYRDALQMKSFGLGNMSLTMLLKRDGERLLMFPPHSKPGQSVDDSLSSRYPVLLVSVLVSLTRTCLISSPLLRVGSP